jgi:non-ribosomal peptide synthetase-like protein
MAFLLLFRWVQLAVMLALMAAAAHFYQRWSHASVAVGLAALPVINILLAAFAERMVMGFRRLTPRFVSIYDPYFWRHERLWKVLAAVPFNGTPFKALGWRLMGVRVGRRLFDDGAGIPEKTLVTLGDDVVLNAGSVIQCHSLEDGTFKSDHTVIGSGTVLGVAAFVHYGVRTGEGTVIDADGFLMKGEETAPFTEWAGNPATEIQASAPVSDDPPTIGIAVAAIQAEPANGDLPTTPVRLPHAA